VAKDNLMFVAHIMNIMMGTENCKLRMLRMDADKERH